MNKRRRHKAKRRRRIRHFIERYNFPWHFGPDNQMFSIRWNAKSVLRSMGLGYWQ